MWHIHTECYLAWELLSSQMAIWSLSIQCQWWPQHATSAAKSPVLLRKKITHFFTNFTAHISRFHTEFEYLLLLLCISHFIISNVHSQPPLCSYTDKIPVPSQKGTRSRQKFPLYYLFTCTSCLYYKHHFIRPHALDCLVLADGTNRLYQNVGIKLPFYNA